MTHEKLVALGYFPTMQFEIQAVTPEIENTGKQYVETGNLIVEDREEVDLTSEAEVDTGILRTALENFASAWEDTHDIMLVQIYQPLHTEGRNECVVLNYDDEINVIYQKLERAFTNALLTKQQFEDRYYHAKDGGTPFDRNECPTAEAWWDVARDSDIYNSIEWDGKLYYVFTG